MQMQTNCNCVSLPIAGEETRGLAPGPKAMFSGNSDRAAGPKRRLGFAAAPPINRRLASHVTAAGAA